MTSHLYKLITIECKNNFNCYHVLSLFFPPPSHEGSLTLYSSIWIIFILHLLIIWALTWVLVPSDTFSGFLWVVVAKTALFKGLLHINVVRKVAAVHLIWWWQLSLRYFNVSFILVCSFSYVPSRMFMRHVLIIGVSWRITLIAGVHTVNYIHHIRGGVPPRTTFHLFPTFKTLTVNI